MAQLKERLPALLDKEKLLNKSHRGKMQNDDNTSPQTPLTPTQLPKTAFINKNQNMNIDTNISEKLKACVR